MTNEELLQRIAAMLLIMFFFFALMGLANIESHKLTRRQIAKLLKEKEVSAAGEEKR